MQLKVILNRVQPHKGFVYEGCELKGAKKLVLEVTVRPDKRASPTCSGCKEPGPGSGLIRDRLATPG